MLDVLLFMIGSRKHLGSGGGGGSGGEAAAGETKSFGTPGIISHEKGMVHRGLLAVHGFHNAVFRKLIKPTKLLEMILLEGEQE
ncbi:hypothetical protein L1987_44277 [Smallanthus sonchifolius]|uniref:Uncharacterized protein n=1 Tax=Smallanthus sonchifolius TaxID=185202 RepID=A0ACB9GNZ3_9ASTR|nr:hypothetical protein L1987_44277 [Smallanthus sonchifolius]